MTNGSEIRGFNRRAVLQRLVVGGPAPRVALARETSLSKPTVTRIVDDLLEEGLVHESADSRTGARGRRASLVHFTANVGVVCGLDIGGSNTRVVISDLSGAPLWAELEETPKTDGSDELARWVSALITGTVRRCKTPGPLLATVIGVPGVVSPATSEMTFSPNLPAIQGRNFAERLRDDLEGTVEFDNDANLALIGELCFGAARETRSAVMFTVGTGVGVGVVVDGHLLRGRTGLVGEFGYLPVAVGSGLTLEDTIAAPGILRRAAERGLRLDSPAMVFSPDASAPLRGLREEVEAALVLAFTAVTAAYEPELIVVGGGVAGSLEAGLAQLRDRVRSSLTVAPDIVVAQCGDLAGALGAMAQAIELALAELGVGSVNSHPPTWAAKRVEFAQMRGPASSNQSPLKFAGG